MNARQGTPEWLAARRELITATDIGILLGVSTYKCEADLADEKRGLASTDATVRMRVGTFVQPLVGEEYEKATGRTLKAWPDLAVSKAFPWAGASPDFRVVGEKRLVEAKWTTSTTRFADGLPQDIEAQVQWQLGVTGYPVADVAVLTPDKLLPIIEVVFDAATFDNLVVVAEDFRRRLAAGGPFSRNLERIRRDHPSDDGTELAADGALTEAAQALLATRGQIADLETLEEKLKAAIQDRMGDAAYLVGPGFRATWKRSKDAAATDYKSLATGLLSLVPETERAALVSVHTSVRPGIRPFRLTAEGIE